MSLAMEQYVTHFLLKFKQDPLNRFQYITDLNTFLGCVGLIPSFLDPWDQERTFTEQLEQGYGMPINWNDARVTPEGIYQSPNDPDLFPLASAEHHVGPGGTLEQVYMYEYAFVAVVANGVARIARLD